MRKLYKLHWDCGRMGDLQSVFAADPKDVKKLIGTEIYFGEVLGKHSEVFGTLEEKDLTVLTEDQSFIEKAEEFGVIPNGHNPFNYVEEEE